MTPKKDIITANPSGQSVPFVDVLHTSLAPLNFRGELKVIIMPKTTKVYHQGFSAQRTDDRVDKQEATDQCEDMQVTRSIGGI